MTISSDAELRWTQDRVNELERSIASSRRRLAESPTAVSDITSLYQNELQELRREVGLFLGTETTPSAPIEFAFETRDGGLGTTSLSALSGVTEGLRIALTSIGEKLSGGGTRTIGRPPARISRAVDLRVVGFAPGSFRLLLEYPSGDLPQGEGLGDLAERSLSVLEDTLAWVESGSEDPPASLQDEDLRRLALAETRRIAPTAVSNVAWVEIRRNLPGRAAPVRVTPETLGRVNSYLERALRAEPVSLVGHLRAIDLDQQSFAILTSEGRKRRCILEPQLVGDAIGYIANQQLVLARGNRDGPRLRIVSLEPLREPPNPSA
jgi:hypothetical protein